jgi:hypothetical protein
LTTESASRGETEPPAVAPAPTARRVVWNALTWFVAAEVIAFPLLLVWGRHGWFTQDDWDFLSARTAGNAGDLFRAHFQHWTTLPILVYRLMWVLVGLHSYTPYQALVVTTHLVAAALLLAVMRRAGVRPWLATVVGVTFVFFGAGAENILVAFQITFVGALVFGLAQLLLSDHDGPIDRRDWLGLLAGFAGLACSGVAVTMTVIVGLAVLLRRGLRGWRVALFHTVPLALAYVVWAELAPKGQDLPSYRSHSPVRIAKFLLIGVEDAFARLGQVPGVGIALGLVLVAGLVLVFGGRRRAPLGRLAVPIALLAGGVLFLVVTGIARAGTGTERARDSRYVYLVAAMVMPALALAADALIRRWRYLTVPLVGLLVVGMPGNIHRLANPGSLPPFANAAQTRAEILALPHLPLAQQLRHSRRPVPIQYPRFALEGLTFGWLVGAAASSRMPDPGPLNQVVVSTRELQLFLVPGQETSEVHCRPAPKLSIHELEAGQKITFERGNVFVTYVRVGGPPSLRLPFKPSTLVALAGPMRLRVVPANKGVLICS